MVERTVTEAEALLEQVRSRRKLPPAPERRAIRERAGVSLRRMAAVIGREGVSAMPVVRWEAGSTPRDPDHLRAYADLLAELKRATNGGDS